MPQTRKRSILSGIRVEAAMSRQVLSVADQRSLAYCISRMVKYKAGALLVTDAEGHPAGVVSKTDLISAYYALLPKETAVGDLIAAAPILCYPDDLLEDAIELMQANGVHRVYVQGAELGEVVGKLAYMEVVGLLYQYCRACLKSTAQRRLRDDAPDRQRLWVDDVMSRQVFACRQDDDLAAVIELLTTHQCGAVLVNDSAGQAAGVISKTDLALAYRHDRPLETPAAAVMQQPVRACAARTPLADALQEMLLWDVQRYFVYDDDAAVITGVLSLSDSARFRSGSCRACISGKMMVEGA